MTKLKLLWASLLIKNTKHIVTSKAWPIVMADAPGTAPGEISLDALSKVAAAMISGILRSALDVPQNSTTIIPRNQILLAGGQVSQ